MARSFGFHRVGARVAYVLLDREPDSPASILAAGSCALSDLPALYQRLAAEFALPWALAEEREGAAAPSPGSDWPLKRPAPRGMIHPARAAALWEWNCGRIEAEDLLLWLRPDRLLWSRGLPGKALAGSDLRRGPLALSLQKILARTGAAGAPVTLAVEGDAPGEALLLKELRARGCSPRPLKAVPTERGADRAAAGAALAALEPGQPFLRPAARPRPREPWLLTLSILAAATLGGSAWLGNRQARALRAGLPVSGPPGPAARPGPRLAAAPPPKLDRMVARRRAVIRALETLPGRIPRGSLEELEIVSAEESRRARVRLRLLPGSAPAPSETPAWAAGLPAGFNLQVRTLEDGSTAASGEVAEEPR